MFKKIKKFIIPSFMCAVTAILSMGLFFYNAFEFPEWILIDSFFKLKKIHKQNLPLVIIEIDKRSILSLGEWPWTRDIHAKLIADLGVFEAKMVAFDVFFLSETDDTTVMSDLILSQSCRISGNEYFSMNFDITDKKSGIGSKHTNTHSSIKRFSVKIDPPKWASFYESVPPQVVSSLYDSINGAVHISVVEDYDGKIRRAPLWLKSGNLYYPQLALRLFMDYEKINGIDFSNNGFMRLTSSESKKDFMVPLDNKGQLFINWQGAFSDSFYRCSYVDVFHAFDDYSKGKEPLINIIAGNKLIKQNAVDFFKDKICIIGFTTAGLVDQKPVPVENRYPLVGLHANIIENMMNSDYFNKISSVLQVALIVAVCILVWIIVYIFSLFWSIVTLIFFSLALVGISLFLFLKYSIWVQTTYLLFSLVSVFVSVIIFKMLNERRKKKYIEHLFKRYVTPEIVEEILKNPELMGLVGKRRELTILFCDIRGFTPMAEQSSPEDVIKILNSFFELTVKIIFKYHGTVDKFIGDCIMAYWGAPAPQKDHAYNAVCAAIEIQTALANFNKKRNSQGLHSIEAGIGISTGEAVVGNIGMVDVSFQKTEYTAIGDNVNLAARLVDLSEANSILVSGSTKTLLRDRVKSEYFGKVVIKGKSNLIDVYKVIIN